MFVETFDWLDAYCALGAKKVVEVCVEEVVKVKCDVEEMVLK